MNNEFLIQKFFEYQKFNQQEKVYVHLDKPNYITGETIWFKVYLRNSGNLVQSEISRAVYVELIDSKQIIRDSRLIYVDSGYSSGDFELPNDMLSGIYRIRAYTNWMRNFNKGLFYDQDIRINAIHTPKEAYTAVIDNYESEFVGLNRLIPEVDLQFFPEGGQLINLVSGKVAFKATDKYGNGIKVEGSLIDSNERKLFTFKSSHNGMGIFYLLPNNSNYLRAVLEKVDGIDTNIEVDFPEVKSSGYVMSARKKNDETIFVHLKTNGLESLNDCQLVVSQGDKILSTNPIYTKKKDHLFKISLRDLNNGIVRLTLFDQLQRPRCERSVFVYHANKKYAPKISVSKKYFGKREPVEVQIKQGQYDGMVIPLEGSVSITNSSLVDLNQKNHSIISYFLLSSDLNGKIENPGEYFENYDKRNGESLDLVMLTHGWNRYTWQDILEYDKAYPKFLNEPGVCFYGSTSGYLLEKKEVKTQVTASTITVPFIHDSTLTDSHGNFAFSSYVFFDTTDFIFQARRYNDKKQKATKSRNVTVNLKKIKEPEVSLRQTIPKLFTDQITERYRLSKYKSVQIDSAYAMKNRIIILDEMTIEDSKIDDSESWALHTWADREIYMEDVGTAGSMLDFVRSRPEFMRIRRFLPRSSNAFNIPLDNNGVLIMIDGMFILYDQLSTIMQSQIEKTEVLNGTSAAVYGSRARNGAIMMYSGEHKYQNQSIGGIKYMTHPGFYQQKEFYSPNYDVPNEEHVKPDYRSTLFWEPNVRTDSSGVAKVKFFTNDSPGEYFVEMEGMVNGDIPFRSTASFTIE